MTETDQLLIQNAQADTQQFAALYQKYVDELRTFIYYHCGNESDVADDLTADLFTKAFHALPNFHWQGHSYRSYLYQMARNRLVDYYRTADRTPVELDPDAISYRSKLSDDVDIRLMWQQIRELGPDVTEVFELRYLQGLSFEEIADIIGKSSGSLRTLISRTIDQLHEHFSL